MDSILPLVQVAEAMAQKYEVVVTNPPYMSVSATAPKLNTYVVKNYPDSKADMFAVFMERCGAMLKPNGYQAMITMHAWMFLSSFEKLRAKLLQTDTVNLVHLGARAFEEIGGEVVQTAAFVFRNSKVPGLRAVYERLIDPNSQSGKEQLFLAHTNQYEARTCDFAIIPGAPTAYWINKNWIEA